MAKKDTTLLREKFLETLGGIEPKDHEYFHGEMADKLILIAEEFYNKPKKPKTITAFTGCIDSYNNFIIERTGLPGKFDGTEGKAMKAIIAYIASVSRDKSDTGIIDSFAYVLKAHSKWEPFHQNQLKLSQINSNLINIINAIKNGTTKKLNNYEQSKYSNNPATNPM